MKAITWSDGFSVGIESLDNQHKTIIKLINKLIAEPDALVDSEIVSEVINEISRYIQTHLAFEESLLKKHGYPNFDQHRNIHAEYKKKYSDLTSAVMNRDEHAPEELLDFLDEWWVKHILYEDMKYSKFLQMKGVT